MKLKRADIGPFKSITTVQKLEIGPEVTILVGMNEAGKTVILRALEKASDALDNAEFDPVDDYPRKDLSKYLQRHASDPDRAVMLTFELENDEVDELKEELPHFAASVSYQFTFSINYYYNNTIRHTIVADELKAIAAFADQESFSTETKAAICSVARLRDIPAKLNDAAMSANEKALIAQLNSSIAKTKSSSVASAEVFLWIVERLPVFLYFGEYELLPSKMNLQDLKQRVEQSKANPTALTSEHRSVLALLRMAGITVSEFSDPGGYEPLKARLEGVSISLTDQIMKFWKQNEDLEVEVDIKADPTDTAPFQNGPNLYLRIKNRRHRGVTTPFRQRSRGFIWFFSFLVWFDEVKRQLDSGKQQDRDLILLLDEPGLSLHALAQNDFVRYIDGLSTKHQVLFTTHSPFMIDPGRLDRVRIVEDRKDQGSVISGFETAADPRTLFPLQAALGWTVSQNLFISKQNVLVEGTSELIYMQTISSILQAAGRTGLRSDLTIVPVGGLDKVATFIALLRGNELEMVVFHDYHGAPEQRIIDLVRDKIISAKRILNAAQFRREADAPHAPSQNSDTEDLFTPAIYLKMFTGAFARQLGATIPTEPDLPSGDRILDRIERWLVSKGISLRQSGGFNHLTVATHFLAHATNSLDAPTLARFEALFTSINSHFNA